MFEILVCCFAVVMIILLRDIYRQLGIMIVYFIAIREYTKFNDMNLVSIARHIDALHGDKVASSK